MSVADFSRAHNLFIDAVTSNSIPNVRKQLKRMKLFDEDLARKCCLKTLSDISEKKDCSVLIKDIIDSQLFEYPHHQSLSSVTPTLVFNAASLDSSAEKLYQTLLHLATRFKYTIKETVDILGDDGFSALHLSVMNGHFRATKHLLDFGSDCNKKSENGNSALSLAIAYGHNSLVPLLLSCEPDVNTQDSDLDTPLIFAAWNNAPTVVSALIQHRANVDVKNRYGSSPIWNAVYQSSAECVLILLRNNSSMDVPCEGTDPFFNESDSHEKITKLYPGHKRSLLWVAVDRIGVNEESLKVLLILLEAGYDVTKEQHWLRNPKRHSAECPNNLLGNPALLEMLQFLSKRPQNLKDLCRNALRKQDGFLDWLQLQSRKIPSTLKNFLTLSYLIQ